MVSFAERMALRQHLALNYTGRGECVEIGAFAGGSTVAIAQGIYDSRHPRKLHVYDAFQFPKNELEEKYRKRLLGINGDSFRQAFDFYTRAFDFMLHVTEGDAAQAKWAYGPIEFMHIDCSISQEFHEAVALAFYPHLLPGAVVAHQDFGYEKAPFIAQMLAKLSPWLKHYMTSETTAYFACTNAMTRDDLSMALASPSLAAA